MSTTDNIVNKGLLLHGIGKGFLETVTGKVYEMTTAQTMKMDVTATTEDVYGGDGLFPLYTYISKKEGTVEIDEAEFSLSQLNIAQQTNVTSTGNKRSYRVLITKSSTTLSSTLSFTGVEVATIIAPDGTKAAFSSTAGDKVISVSATGAVAFGAGVTAQDGEYAVWFKADSTNSVSAAMLKNAMPEVATFNWMFTTIDSAGNEYQVDFYARRVRCDGKFSFETARDKATVPKLTVKILDPGDGHDDFAVITITKL